MSFTFHLPLKRIEDLSYDIVIGRGLMQQFAKDITNLMPAHRYALITDSSVAKLYIKPFLKALKNHSIFPLVIDVPPGEKSKTREYKALIEDKMIQAGFRRDSAIITFGGGMISDLGGFVAGTFCRGIPFIVYATSLLAAADASIGGKTAIDTNDATNLIGLFHQPQAVYIDWECWKTLPIKEISCGLAETIKHACLADEQFFEYLEHNIHKIIDAKNKQIVLDETTCEYIGKKNCEIKHLVVSNDEKESNLRQILNLGHTFGRALEALYNYQLLHGECVAIGLVMQLELGKTLGFVNQEQINRVKTLLENTLLPINPPSNITIDDLIDKMYKDKKVKSGTLNFVFQDGIGKMKQYNGNYAFPIEEKTIRRFLKNFFNQ